MDTGSVAKPVESEGDCPAKITTRGRKRVAAEMLTSSNTYPTTESVSKRSAAGQPDENDSDRLTLPALRPQLECKSSEPGAAEFLHQRRTKINTAIVGVACLSFIFVLFGLHANQSQ